MAAQLSENGAKMGNLVIEAIVFGMVLGLFFKWPILVPASLISAVLVLMSQSRVEHGVAGWFLTSVAAAASLQTGYMIGLIACFFGRAPEPFGKTGLADRGEIPSRFADCAARGCGAGRFPASRQ